MTYYDHHLKLIGKLNLFFSGSVDQYIKARFGKEKVEHMSAKDCETAMDEIKNRKTLSGAIELLEECVVLLQAPKHGYVHGIEWRKNHG